MNLVIDCREAALIARCRAILATTSSSKINLVVRSLPLGDILLERVLASSSTAPAPLLIFERKALPDLLASITDGRYAEQSFRLAHHPHQLPPHQVVYLLEGSIAALPRPADRQRCFSVLASCQFVKGFSTMRTESLDDTANYLLATALKICGDLDKGKTPYHHSGDMGGEHAAGYASVVHTVKKANLSAANIGVVCLSQIPGFSAASAQCVMDAVVPGGMRQLLEELGNKAGRDRLRELSLGQRRLGDAAVARLCAFLRPDVYDDVSTDAPARKKKTKGKRRAAAVGDDDALLLPAAKKRKKPPMPPSVFPREDDDDDAE